MEVEDHICLVMIVLKSPHGKYNCEKDGVLTTVVIKKNNERFQGHISLEKLVDYITTEPLLEKN